ncbi:hypothetical protein PsAD2_00509 [Pseudovibrio axinellae]|uniref:Flavodoxin-like fold domain-containing protein n=1 Tax=Pseudovibrio axinellae TaxID=989403 RepID=A0A166AK47_9HYPH|nr:NAD(P)H-dependent oxidoreductase [Pseudovibrio axinellae]KZL21220.1 hypothetical protein PsAD2_00509 [Pseudovibrio axinellae]SEQ92469.1 Putative NADPH-quinone reductase (modulator of drug activity B) [Pseudovibrio axinellae]
MKNILVLSAHMGEGRFGQALAKNYVDSAKEHGANVRFTNLESMVFNPNFDEGIFALPREQIEKDILEFQDNLMWCDHWTTFHPLWWGSMPGKLKSLLDRSLTTGFAYQYEEGQSLPTKLLKGRSARLLVTANTPEKYFNGVYEAAHRKVMQNQVFDFIGFEENAFNLYSPLVSSSVEQRALWLEEAYTLGAQDAAATVTA